MINVYKENNDYATIGTDKGTYLIGYGEILAFKPSPKMYSYFSLYIEKRVYDSYTQCSNELVNQKIDCISKFVGRTPIDIVKRVNDGEFTTQLLQDLF